MAFAKFQQQQAVPRVVGSFGSIADLGKTTLSAALKSCDIAEIRLDLLVGQDPVEASRWKHLRGIPLLFTARRTEEGGRHSLNADDRQELLKAALEDATIIDIEVASIDEMPQILKRIEERQIPWIASFHDFEKLPTIGALAEAAKRARDAGAAAFKVAAMVSTPEEMAELARFQLSDQGIPLATMGMGPLAPVSRLLCAQCGSLLNYGFLGKTATAPGQWDSFFLKDAISRLVPIT